MLSPEPDPKTLSDVVVNISCVSCPGHEGGEWADLAEADPSRYFELEPETDSFSALPCPATNQLPPKRVGG